MIASQRYLFDIPDDIAYLNCAYMSPSLKAVTAAGEAGVRRKAQPWEITSGDFFGEPNEARALFASLVGATADDIAIVPAASYGLATAAKNLPLAKGQRIITLKDQFPSNLYIWREVAKAAGAEVVTLERTAAQGNAGWTEIICDAIDERTAIVATSNCRWTDGALTDLAAVRKRTKEVGAALVVDACQSLGALPLDVRNCDPDFLVAPCYKWLLGPYSLGFLYVAPRHQEGRPLEESWMTRARADDFARLVDYADQYQAGARRFDMGEFAHFHLMPMALAALRQILDWGVDNIAETLSARTRDIATRAAELGLESEPEHARAGHFLGLKRAGGLPPDLPARLAEAHVHVSLRGPAMRVTPHLYNTDADVDRFFDVLKKTL